MKKEEFFSEASRCISAGVSVIPVGKNKVPLVPWKEYQERLAKEAEIKIWMELPDVQLGIVTGRVSNLTVVDVEAGGDPSFLPQDTAIIKTGGGGWHYYFEYCPQVRNKTRVKEFVDLRSEGGYVVAPGSESNKGKYEILKKEKWAKFPLFLFQGFLGLKTASNSSWGGLEALDDLKGVKSSPNSVPTGTLSLKTRDMVLSQYPGYGSGQRNDQMVRFIGFLLREIHPADWDKNVWPIIFLANQKNTPPLGESELRKSFESIKGAEKRNPESLWNVGVKKEEPWQAGEVDDSLAHLSEVAKAHHIDLSKVYPCGLDLFDKEIRGGFVPGDMIIIAAPSGEGKSSLSQHLAFNFIKYQKEKVLFFSYEVLPFFVWEKFSRMGLTTEDIIVMPMDHPTGNVEWIEKKIKEGIEKYGVKMVVIDDLTYLTPRAKKMNKFMGENYSLLLTNIVLELKRIAIENGIIIISPTHMRKRVGGDRRKHMDIDINDIANSAGIFQKADLVFMMKREETVKQDATDLYTGYTLVFLAKNRRGSKNPKGYYELLNDFFVHAPYHNREEPAPVSGNWVSTQEKKEEDVDAKLQKQHEDDLRQASFLELANK